MPHGSFVFSLALMPLAGAQLTMSQIGLAERQVVADTMSRVAEYQIAKYGGHPPTNWITGTFYTGMLAAYAATGNEDYLRQATAWCEAAQWKIPAPHLNADQICTAQTYLDIYAIKRDAAMIADTKAALETMFNREFIPRDELGHVMWKEKERPFTGRNLWWWCDSLYMAPPVLAAMSSATGDPKYRELLHNLYWDSIEFLFDPQEELVFRDEGQFKASSRPRRPMAKKSSGPAATAGSRSAHGRRGHRVSWANPTPATWRPRGVPPLRAAAPREDAAPQDRVGEPRDLARVARSRRAGRAGIR